MESKCLSDQKGEVGLGQGNFSNLESFSDQVRLHSHCYCTITNLRMAVVSCVAPEAASVYRK